MDYAAPDDYKKLEKPAVNVGVDIGYGSGFKKGSDEAKAHMKKIRAMRKKKKGEGIKDDIVEEGL